MHTFNSPFPLCELTDIDVFGGEAVGENHNNNNFRNDVPRLSLTPPEQPGGDVIPLAWTPNGGDANDLASALTQHTEALKSNQQETQLLVESVAKLTTAIKVLEHGTKSRNNTVNRKSHNKK